jgi:predicted secreted protein
LEEKRKEEELKIEEKETKGRWCFLYKGRKRRRIRKRRGMFVMKKGIMVFLLGHFTDGFTDI